MSPASRPSGPRGSGARGRPPSKGPGASRGRGQGPNRGSRPPAGRGGSGRPTDAKSAAQAKRGGRPGDRTARPQPEEVDPADQAPRHWGSLARKGTRQLGGDRRGAGTAPPRDNAPSSWEPEEWIDEGPVQEAARGAVRRGSTRRRSAAAIDTSAADVGRSVGAKDAARFEARLKEAAKAYEAERYQEARKILVPLAERMPGNGVVRELLGLTYYGMGRWKDAIAELEAFRSLENSTEQHPVLADCYRALKQWSEAEALWDELREVSPSAELVTEGRIVAAGTLADRGRLPEAIALLDKGFRFPKQPGIHHLRRAYALADLRERAGDIPQARSLFERIVAIDPDFGDAVYRVRALR